MVNTYQELNKAGVNGQAAKRKKRELDLGMDYLINADQCTGLMCRRKVFDVCFDNEAADALDDWREQKTISTYGWSHLNDLGPSLVLPNCTLDRIVDCAHHRKINSILDLKKETGWTDSDRFGNEIITLIQRHAPPIASPFVTMPLSYPSTGNVPVLATPCPAARTNAPTLKHKNKCSACNNEGHNARNRVCPRHLSRAAQNKENDQS
ncbi:hypothetical protein F4604DRAFT_1578316 [Suillus subluteus]|nr:hypothetical protein F4604DRAFT_1578316 [Suillus subluteus]